MRRIIKEVSVNDLTLVLQVGHLISPGETVESLLVKDEGRRRGLFQTLYAALKFQEAERGSKFSVAMPDSSLCLPTGTRIILSM